MRHMFFVDFLSVWLNFECYRRVMRERKKSGFAVCLGEDHVFLMFFAVFVFKMVLCFSAIPGRSTRKISGTKFSLGISTLV